MNSKKTSCIVKKYLFLVLLCLITPLSFSQTISPLLYGINAWMPHQYGTNEIWGKMDQLWGRVQDCHIGFVRIGGIIPDYDQPTNAQYISMIDSIRNIGAEPLVQVSYADGVYNETQAANLVKYINVDMHRNVKYWSIANEPDLKYGITSPTLIATYFKKFATAMKVADPTIKIVGPDLSYLQFDIYRSLIGGVDDITGKDANGNYMLDVISFHSYIYSGNQTRAQVTNEALGVFQEKADSVIVWINKSNLKNNRTAGNALSWAVTEFNIDYQNPTTNNAAGLGVHGFVNGQHWAECLGICMKYSALSFLPWSVHESNGDRSLYDLGFLDGPNGTNPRSSYYHVQLMSLNNKTAFAPSTDNKSLVKVVSTKNNTGTTVMILNQELTTSYNYTIRLDNTSIATASALKINIDKGQATEYTSTLAIPAQTTQVVVFDNAGNVQKIIEYSLTDAQNQTAPRVVYATSIVTTQAVSSIAATTATGNGNITSLGSPNPTVSGICWNTSTSPTTSNFKTTNGPTGVTGAYTGSMTGLIAGQTYYVRAYATNSGGTSYGSEVSFATLTNGTFTAATNTDWATATNWAGGSVPTSSTDVTIPSGKNPIIGATTQASCNNLTVTGSLTIQSSSSGTGSLIINGTSTGTVTAERYMTGNKWHIVSPIAAFGSISTFIQAPGNAIPSKNVSGTNRYGMMDYNETTNTWNTFYAATTPDILPAGKGYSIRRTSDGIVTFIGDLTSGQKLVSLSMVGQGWNCIGNPYTSAINMNNAANASYNFLKTNAIDYTSLDPSYACIYVWDDATLSYKIQGNVSFGTRDLLQNVFQAGQGFFVKAAYDGVLVQFTNNMQVHQTATPFRAPAVTTSWLGIALKAASADASSSAIIAFNEKMTKGLDPTYDAGLLRGTNSLSLYTRLVEDNGVDFAIQCLPESYDNMVIPVGVDCKDGGEITFSAETVELPKNCKVMIEDKTTNTFTSLAEGGTYKTTVLAGTTPVGRFYIHTSENTTTGTSGLTPETSSLKAYIANDAIIIEGEVSDQAIATLYNLQGVKVRVNLLKKGYLNTLPCSDLTKGIYLLTIQQNGKTATKKLIKE